MEAQPGIFVAEYDPNAPAHPMDVQQSALRKSTQLGDYSNYLLTNGEMTFVDGHQLNENKTKGKHRENDTISNVLKVFDIS